MAWLNRERQGCKCCSGELTKWADGDDDDDDDGDDEPILVRCRKWENNAISALHQGSILFFFETR